MKTELIKCIGLPGKKLISRHICGQRHLLAIKRAQVSVKTNLDIAHMSSLEVCGTCVEGSINAKIYKHEILENAKLNL
jgi:hypothetical protein